MMPDRVRQSIGGLCIAVALLVIGLVLRPASEGLSGVLLFAALLTGVVCLLNIGLDLIGKSDERG